MSASLLLALALAAQTPPVVTPAPEATAAAEPAVFSNAWWDRWRIKARDRLPTPLGWVGVAGMMASGFVVAGGLALAGAASVQILRGRAAQDAYDRSHADTTTTEGERAQLALLKDSRDAFDSSRWLALAGGAVLVIGLLGSLAGGTAVIVDETFFVPALRARHPLWAIFGPALGTREPPEMWPPVPRPDVPGVFTPPRDPAPKPPAAAVPPAPVPAPEPAPPPPAPVTPPLPEAK
ncbi:MAG: hypothetical protein HY904_20845 [Deltaproteobacteria bacterium]|nr:hypothetical protein [Deltaproteobacteria bacterium]